MRSEKYATFFRVGQLNSKDVYWSPASGFTVEEDYRYLVPIDNLDEVEWFVHDRDYEILATALKENKALVESVPNILMMALLDYARDLEEAEAYNAEKEATLRQGSGVY